MGVISTNSHVCTQALLAFCTLAGIQFPGNNNLGRGEKG